MQDGHRQIKTQTTGPHQGSHGRRDQSPSRHQYLTTKFSQQFYSPILSTAYASARDTMDKPRNLHGVIVSRASKAAE